MKFTELNLDKDLMKGIESAGFTTLMPVQEETLTHTLKGKDVSVQSQTGTGKTAAFLITIFQHFLAKETKRSKKALILAPTRELAVQIEKDAKVLGKYLPFTIGSFYGGVGYNQQERLLQKNVEIIIGTPGRLLDFSYKKKLNLKDVGFLVIDEADRMFDMGFYPDITRILRNASSSTKRQNMLFSATLDVKTRSIAREFMNHPVTIEIAPEQVTVDKIEQKIYHVARKEKLNLMLGVLKKELPKNALIFTNTKDAAAQVAKHLEYNGYKCLHISGDLPQNKRLRVIDDFKSGKLPFLVATDVAARGLHIDGLEMIFNYDLPGDSENYVHRIGRTARAGKSGKAVSLACEDYIYNLEPIETLLGIKIPIAYAEDDLYEESKSQGMRFDVRKRGGGSGDKKRKQKTTHAKVGPRKTAASHAKKHKKDDRSKPAKDEKQTTEGRTKKKRRPKQVTPKTTGTKQHTDKKRSDKRKPDQKKPDKKKSTTKTPEKKTRKGTLDDRLEYYKKKYGDNFKITSEPSTSHVKQTPRQKKSLLKRISDVFKKKGKGVKG